MKLMLPIRHKNTLTESRSKDKTNRQTNTKDNMVGGMMMGKRSDEAKIVIKYGDM